MRCYHCTKELPSENISFCPFCGKKPKEQNASHRLAAGTVLHNRYLIGATLGEGGFGITYVGFDQTLYIKVAVKEYYPSGIASRVNSVSNDVSVSVEKQKENFEKGKESFLNEARNVAQFSNENGVVDVRDFFTENNTAYIVMEFLDGVNLNEYIHKKGIMDAQKLFTMMLPLMRSLEKMHKENIIHRDISPDNIMLLKNGTLKLMDFGAARQFSRDGSMSLSVVLKPGYAPYEQYSRKGKQGPWTDVYALCATIYNCITGKTPSDSFDRAIEDDLKKPSDLGIPIPKNLENALMMGLAVQPQDRLQSIGELIKTSYSPVQPPIRPVVRANPQSAVSGNNNIKREKKKSTAAPLIIGISVALALVFLGLIVFKPFSGNRSSTITGSSSPKAASSLATEPTNYENEVAPTIEETTSFTADEMQEDEEESSTTLDSNNESYSPQELKQIRETLITERSISARYYHDVALKTDGTIKSTGWNKYAQCDLSGWSDIVEVSAGYSHTVGLKSNGTVVAKGNNDSGQCNVEGWTDIVAISCGYKHTVGLKSNGTVVSVGLNDYNQCNIENWTNIVDISAGYSHTVGLKADGTVVAIGWNKYGQCDLSGWNDIVSISAGGMITLGIKSNGAVVAMGNNDHGQREVDDWTDIVAVGQGDWHTVGLKSNGQVVATGSNSDGQCDVKNWENVVSLSVGAFHTVGVKSDGTVVAAGRNNYGQCNVSDWTNIKTN